MSHIKEFITGDWISEILHKEIRSMIGKQNEALAEGKCLDVSDIVKLEKLAKIHSIVMAEARNPENSNLLSGMDQEDLSELSEDLENS